MDQFENNGWIALLRAMRIIQTLNLKRQFATLRAHYPSLNNAIGILKSILVVIFVWHWTSCIFFYNFVANAEKNPDELSWYYQNDFQSASLGIKLMNSWMFTMSIAATTGYYEHRVYNDYERLIFIIIIYAGGALFAFGFGLMSSSTKLFSDAFETSYEFLM